MPPVGYQSFSALRRRPAQFSVQGSDLHWAQALPLLERLLEAMRDVLRERLAHDPRVSLLGQDRAVLAELSRQAGPEALAYFDAVPRSWNLTPSQRYPMPLVDLSEGRERALAAYANRGLQAVEGKETRFSGL